MTAQIIPIRVLPNHPPPVVTFEPTRMLCSLKASRCHHLFEARRLRNQIKNAAFFGIDAPIEQWREWRAHHVRQARRFDLAYWARLR